LLIGIRRLPSRSQLGIFFFLNLLHLRNSGEKARLRGNFSAGKAFPERSTVH
jgi:hypothetical protein